MKNKLSKLSCESSTPIAAGALKSLSWSGTLNLQNNRLLASLGFQVLLHLNLTSCRSAFIGPGISIFVSPVALLSKVLALPFLFPQWGEDRGGGELLEVLKDSVCVCVCVCVCVGVSDLFRPQQAAALCMSCGLSLSKK